MTVNPDPKPGRWILPLVILAMVGFTYFFVSALPEASPDTTLAGIASTTTTADTGTATTQPTNGSGNVDADTQTYLDDLDGINSDLQLLRTELVTVNTAWDSNPREISYTEIENRMVAVGVDTQSLADRVGALTVPVGLESYQASFTAAISLCSTSAADALAGLRSTDTGEKRKLAVDTYIQSAADFDTEVQNVKTAAGAS